MDREGASSFWNGVRVLVTGNTGFKGSWLSLWLQRLGAEVSGLALPPPSGGAFEAMNLHEEMRTVGANICDAEAVGLAMETARPTLIFHLAAQALVGGGWQDPLQTFGTNVLGTVNVIEAARRCPSVTSVVVVTSDKVYEGHGDAPCREGDPLGGNDPYSASKAAQEMVVSGYRSLVRDESRLRLATVRSGNVVGGGDIAPDRLIPDLIRAIRARRPLIVRQPTFVRPWQYVLEPLHGYLLVAQQLLSSHSFPSAVNFGPNASHVTVAELLNAFAPVFGLNAWREGPSMMAETPHLRLDSTLAREAYGWQCRLDTPEIARWTAEWYRAQDEGTDMRTFSAQQIARYETLTSKFLPSPIQTARR